MTMLYIETKTNTLGWTLCHSNSNELWIQVLKFGLEQGANCSLYKLQSLTRSFAYTGIKIQRCDFGIFSSIEQF